MWWLLAVLVVIGVGAPAAQAAESIAAYDVDAVVSTDGLLEITETITYDFDAGSGPGIVRSIPMWEELPGGTRWVHPVTVRSITVDATAVPFEVSDQGALLEIRIGDPDVTVSGVRVYVITYVVEGALRTFTEPDLATGNPYGFSPGDVELYWDFIGTDWEVAIGNVRVDVTGPGSVLAAQCIPGVAGSGGRCNDRISGSAVTFRAPLLLPAQGLTTAIAYPGSAFATAPVRLIETIPITESPTRVFFPVALILSLMALAAPMIIVVLMRRRIGRADESSAGVRFEIPAGLRPAEIEVGLGGALTSRAVLATLLDLVARRQITMSTRGRADVGADVGDVMELTRQGGGADPVRPWEQRFVAVIFTGRDRVSLQGYDADFANAVQRMRTDLTREVVAAQQVDAEAASPRRRVGYASVLGIFVTMAAYGLGEVTDNALISAGLAPILAGLTVGLFLAAFLVPDDKTVQSQRWEADAASLRTLLSTDPGSVRRDLVQRSGLPDDTVYVTMLPYAVLFDLETSWSGAFPDLTEDQLHSSGLVLASTSAVHALMSIGVDAVSSASTPPGVSYPSE